MQSRAMYGLGLQEAELQASAESGQEGSQQLFQAWDPNTMQAEPAEGPQVAVRCFASSEDRQTCRITAVFLACKSSAWLSS